METGYIIALALQIPWILWLAVPRLCSAIGRVRLQRRTEARLRELRPTKATSLSRTKRYTANGRPSPRATETSGDGQSGRRTS